MPVTAGAGAIVYICIYVLFCLHIHYTVYSTYTETRIYSVPLPQLQPGTAFMRGYIFLFLEQCVQYTLYSCKSNFSIRVSTIIGLAYRLASLSRRFRSFNFTGHEANVYIRILFESISCASELHLYTYCTQCSTVYEI